MAAEKVEIVYLASEYIDQISFFLFPFLFFIVIDFIYIFITCGDIVKYEQNSVFAIVVPHQHALESKAKELKINFKIFADLCEDETIKKIVCCF